MQKSSASTRTAKLWVRNIGGIDETEICLNSGVNVLMGQNATNRTSFLRALAGVLGSDRVNLKGDADSGCVELDLNDEMYERRFYREDNAIYSEGESYLEDSTKADMFAFLFEDNAARKAIKNQEDLREVIMEPVDTAEVERQIREAENQKDRLDEEITTREQKKEQLSDLEVERESLDTKLAERRSKLEEVEAELEALNANVDQSKERRDKFQERLSKLNDARTELEQTQEKLSAQKAQIESLKEERTELREERDALTTSVSEINDLGQRIGELRERKRTLDSNLDRLQNVIQFNENILENASSELREVLVPDVDHVTDELLAGNRSLRCWTCGSEVDRSDINEMQAELRELREEKVASRDDIVDELDKLQAEKRELEENQQRREKIERQLQQVEEQLDRRESTVNDLRDEIDDLEEQIETLEAEVEDMDRANEKVLDLSQQVNGLQVEIENLEAKREDIEEQIADLEAAVSEIETLRSKREEVQSRLTDLRSHIDRVEEQAVEAFNNHIETILDLLQYENIERIWIERRKGSVQSGAHGHKPTEFDLHVVRTTADGAVYEDSVAHLSESEREVTGLVFGLAGYLVHDVHESVPFILLDSLEMVDSDRIAELVGYFQEYAEFLVVALLPEDARAIKNVDNKIQNI